MYVLFSILQQLNLAYTYDLLRVLYLQVHFIVAACENMISGTGMRPGDVVTASNGKTIEVLSLFCRKITTIQLRRGFVGRFLLLDRCQEWMHIPIFFLMLHTFQIFGWRCINGCKSSLSDVVSFHLLVPHLKRERKTLQF